VSPLWAIAVALPHEAAVLLDRMIIRAQTQFKGMKLFEGRLGECDCVLLQMGMGPRRAEAATRFLLEQFPVSHLLCTGYCGGLREGIKNSDAVVAQTLQSYPANIATLTSEVSLVGNAKARCEQLKIPYYEGALVTVPHPVLQVPDKVRLRQETGALAVDMESYEVVKVCTEAPKKIASLTVRFVVDALGDELTDTEAFLDEDAKVKPLGLFREVFRRPKLLVELPGLERKANHARVQLGRFVLKFFGVQ
jgi:adenosylhomocysteine nucleosidase